MQRLYIVILPLILLSACHNDDSVSTGGQTIEIWPLNIGSVWYSEITEYDSAFTIKSFEGHTIEITSDTIISGERWFLAGAGSIPVRNRNDGYYFLTGLQSGKIAPVLYLPYPAKFNQMDSTILGITKVVSTDSLITIDNITYSCYAYVRTFSLNVTTSYTEFYSPGIGPIRRDGYSITQGGTRYLSERIIYHKQK